MAHCYFLFGTNDQTTSLEKSGNVASSEVASHGFCPSSLFSRLTAIIVDPAVLADMSAQAAKGWYHEFSGSEGPIRRSFEGLSRHVEPQARAIQQAFQSGVELVRAVLSTVHLSHLRLVGSSKIQQSEPATLADPSCAIRRWHYGVTRNQVPAITATRQIALTNFRLLQYVDTRSCAKYVESGIPYRSLRDAVSNV
jgi:hypothetical protein